jgi:hypothetical protein
VKSQHTSVIVLVLLTSLKMEMTSILAVAARIPSTRCLRKSGNANESAKRRGAARRHAVTETIQSLRELTPQPMKKPPKTWMHPAV